METESDTCWMMKLEHCEQQVRAAGLHHPYCRARSYNRGRTGRAVGMPLLHVRLAETCSLIATLTFADLHREVAYKSSRIRDTACGKAMVVAKVRVTLCKAIITKSSYEF
jgi:hypothetical protein